MLNYVSTLWIPTDWHADLHMFIKLYNPMHDLEAYTHDFLNYKMASTDLSKGAYFRK